MDANKAPTSTNTVVDLYARVSRKTDKRDRSVQGQLAVCREVADQHGWTVGQEHLDDGISAWRKNARRPGWDALMERLSSGRTGGVVVFDLARFSRRPIEGEHLIEFAEGGLIVADSESTYDLTTGTGKAAFRDQMKSAALYSDEISRRTRRGKKLKAQAGETNHSWRPFGFEPDGVTVRQSEADVIADCTRRLLAGETLDPMVDELNAAGVLTSTERPWIGTTLKAVLLRPRNAGLVEHNGVTVGRLPGQPIVGEDDFHRLEARYAVRKRGRPVSDRHLASGVAVCGRCGNRLSGRPRRGGREYVCCKRAGRGGCWGIAVDGEALDRRVREVAVKELAGRPHLGLLASFRADPLRYAEAAQQVGADWLADALRAMAEPDPASIAISRELAEAESNADRLGERLAAGGITLDRYDKIMEPLDRRIADLRVKAAEVPLRAFRPTGGPRPIAMVEQAVGALWDASTVAERRAVLRQALGERELVVLPADMTKARRFDPERVVVR